MITSRAVFPLHYCITGVSSRRHAATRDYAETLIWCSAVCIPRCSLTSTTQANG
jgi:hypothetical protein